MIGVLWLQTPESVRASQNWQTRCQRRLKNKTFGGGLILNHLSPSVQVGQPPLLGVEGLGGQEVVVCFFWKWKVSRKVSISSSALSGQPLGNQDPKRSFFLKLGAENSSHFCGQFERSRFSDTLVQATSSPGLCRPNTPQTDCRPP